MISAVQQEKTADYGRGSYQSEDRRPQGWNRQAETTSYPTREPETRPSAFSGLGMPPMVILVLLPCSCVLGLPSEQTHGCWLVHSLCTPH